MKKIMFYTSGVGLGGVERILLNILGLLNLDGIDIKVGLQYANENNFEFEIPHNVNCEYMLPQKKIDKILKIRKKKKNNLLYKIYYSFLLKKERKIIKENYLEFSKDRDIVIDFKGGDFARITTLGDAKKICWYHGSLKTTTPYKKNPTKHREYLNKYNKIVVICDDMKKEMVEAFPELEKKIVRIYNYFNFEKIKDLSLDNLGLTKKERKMLEKNYIVAVSRLEYDAKGYPTLLKAFKLAKENGLKEQLYIVGSGADREKIEKKIKELGLEDEVKLLGLQKNPYIWMKNAKLFVHASKHEGLPTVLIESMICKTPIISTDCPTGPREILEGGKNGILVEVGDYKEMALKLNELMNDVNLREKYKKNSTKSLSRFDSEEIRAQIQKLIEEL